MHVYLQYVSVYLLDNQSCLGPVRMSLRRHFAHEQRNTTQRFEHYTFLYLHTALNFKSAIYLHYRDIIDGLVGSKLVLTYMAIQNRPNTEYVVAHIINMHNSHRQVLFLHCVFFDPRQQIS